MSSERTFERLTVEEFSDLLDHFPFDRRINAVHMHHTFRPAHQHWRDPIQGLLGMWRHHTQERGFVDIAQHVTIDPSGTIWTGRNWNLPPASATGHNGSRQVGPFMFEMVGDFDHGRDPWHNQQRETALNVAALVLAKFGVPATAGLRFHNQMSPKSCPGTSIDFPGVVAEVERRRGELPLQLRDRPRDLEGGEQSDNRAQAATRRAIELLNSSRQLSRALGEEWTDEGELPETHPPGGAASATSARGARGEELTASQLEALRPHAVNLRFGVLSNSGAFNTTPADVDRMFGEHLPAYLETQKAAGRKPRLLFYAHGGLVDEAGGLGQALDSLSFYQSNHVYPIFFIWETGLRESIADILRNALIGARNVFTDLSDGLIEGASRRGGLQVWGQMKRSAETSVLEGGGALLVAQKAGAFCRTQGNDVEVHAVGHSAGAIFHSHFVPALLAHGVPSIRSVQLLAPAVNIPTFKTRLLPRATAGDIGHLRMYTMRRALELDDTAGPYRKSLLYLVHHAFEDPDETGVLGLEENAQADRDVAQFFGIGGSAAHAAAGLVFSQSASGAPPDRASQSTSHGGFDNDPATMNSVMRTMLGIDAAASIESFEQRVATRQLSVSDPLAELAIELQSPAATFVPSARPSGRVGHGKANAAALGQAAAIQTAAPAPGATSSGPVRPGRKHAICVGINDYPQSPLKGCVKDSQDWRDVLHKLGFEITAIPEQKATRAGLTAALTNAVAETRAGDVLVFQFAGHGTFIDDDGNADEPDDEAFVPIDFETNGFFRDDEIRLILDGLPAGANATLIIDCCHSGGMSRELARSRQPKPDERPRQLKMTDALREVHRRTRVALPRARAAVLAPPRRDFWLMACQKAELAWESAGRGDFTRLASPLFSAGASTLSYAALQAQIDRQFLSNTRQHPLLDCDAQSKTFLLFANQDASAIAAAG